MAGQGHTSLVTFMVAVAAIYVSLAFNIDTENSISVPNPSPKNDDVEEGNDFFGYKVLQFISRNNKGVIVSAPLKNNGTGGICSWIQGNTSCYSPEAETIGSVKHFGLSIAGAATHSKFTACSPSLAHECYKNSYVNGICYQFSSPFQEPKNLTPAFKACTKKPVDLVFLFDGSRSMSDTDFGKNKDFILDVMETLKKNNASSIKFAAVQFSQTTRTVFDFNDYQSGSASEYLQKEKHMKLLTNTHGALNFVLENLLEKQTAGASHDATKVLVIITDGNPTDKDKGIIQTYDDKNIIRFVIGVKDVALDKLKLIASDPKENNTFKIENYNGLAILLKNFERKILNIEGSSTALAEYVTDEMSQSGFSAIYHKDTLVLGSVGTNTWRGSINEIDGLKEKKIQDVDMKEGSYMGYSVAVGEKNNVPLYFTGAPRYEHKGQVVLFQKAGNNWTVATRLDAEQIGSYFGAELCTTDIDSDGNTDFVLVGAPLFYQAQEKREGQIYVYALTQELQLKNTLNVSVPSRGRFGTTISSVSDLNGDNRTDVAVGAPLEDNNKGAVYIYLGDKLRGIQNHFSQRITAERINPQLQFFGLALDGKMDLTEDGLTDIVVGSRGSVNIFRSKPVLSISAHPVFGPEEISTENIDCVGHLNADPLPMGTLRVCFDMTESTKSKSGAVTTGLNISYTLAVDPERPMARGFFNKTDKESRNLLSDVVVKSEKSCFNHSVHMPKCVEDTLSPIKIRLNFSQPESHKQTATLNVDSLTQVDVSVPFQRDCRQNDTCIAELEVDFNFSTPTLVVAHQDFFNVTVELSNPGDDSYNTYINLHYPPGLSFSILKLVKSTRPTLHSCKDLEGVMDRTTCGVSLPVYRSKSRATFKTEFRIISEYEWNDTMSMTITGTSDNDNSTGGSKTKTIPVQYEIDLTVRVNEATITFLNFTPEHSAPKTLLNVYEVRNSGFKALPVNVTIHVPTKLEHDFEVKNYHVWVQENKTQCTVHQPIASITKTSGYCSSNKSCKSIMCETFILDKDTHVRFTLSGKGEFKNLMQYAKSMPLRKHFTGTGEEVQFKSFIEVTYDDKRYVQASSKHKINDDSIRFPQIQTDVRIELIVPPNKELIIGAGAGGGILLLLIITVVMFKMGCFKRKTRQDFEEEEDNANNEQPSVTTASNVPPNTDGPAEANPLLDDGGKGNEAPSTSNAVQ